MSRKRTPAAAASAVPADLAALLRASFECAPDGLVLLDAQGRQIMINNRFVEMWGFPPDMLARNEVTEMRAFVVQHLVDSAEFIGRLTEAPLPQAAPVLIECRDGRVFERQVAPLPRQAGAQVVRWRDVTRRERALAAAAQARERLAAVFDHALDAILLTADDGRYLDANPAACTLLGYSREQLLAMSARNVLPITAEQFQRTWQNFLRQGSQSGEAELVRGDGTRLVARYNSVANIQPGVHLAILSDVSAEFRLRQTVFETSAQLELAMGNADMAFWAVDLAPERMDQRHAAGLSQTLGYSSGVVRDRQSFDDLVHPEDRVARLAAWMAHVEGRTESYEAEFRMRHADGRWLWLLSRGRATQRDANGHATRVVGTRIDITRRKLAEQQLEHQAFTDGLTGALNRRRFLELAEVELSRATRHGHALALLMIDLDHFKRINDRHGHAVGDAVLASFVGIAQSVMRASDLFGRLGGEEFAALLPETDAAGAAALARRLSQLVHAQPLAVPGAAGAVGGAGATGAAGKAAAVAYTVSIGVAAGPLDSMDSLLLAADRALYAAKRDGRNRVVLAEAEAG